MTALTIPEKRNWVGLVLLGLAVGLASGLFGYYTRISAGTSLLAVVLPAVVGVITYAIDGNVNLLMAVLLAAGSIFGAPLGSWLLTVLSHRVVLWGFIGFMMVVIASLFVVIPSRDTVVDIDWLLGAGLVLLGLFTGVMSGLLGIGGGVIIVPLLVVVFGASDLTAKGTSLLVIIATGASGTLANLRRRNVDPPAALVIGGAAAVATPTGVWAAYALDPATANIVFAVFLALVLLRMLVDALRRKS